MWSSVAEPFVRNRCGRGSGHWDVFPSRLIAQRNRRIGAGVLSVSRLSARSFSLRRPNKRRPISMLWRGIFIVPLCGKTCDNKDMIEKVVTRRSLKDRSAEREDLAYWLSRPAGERMEAVEIMRREFNGDLPRLQRVARVIQRD